MTSCRWLVSLEADLRLNSGIAGTVVFAAPIDGPHAWVAVGQGTLQLLQSVGAQNPLSSGSVDAGGSKEATNVFTTGRQSYGNDLWSLERSQRSMSRFPSPDDEQRWVTVC